MFAAQDGAAASPSNQPAAAAPNPTSPPTEQKPAEAKTDEEKADEDTGFKLFKNVCFLDEHRIDVRGWLDQGFTWNPSNPTNGFNGPVGYNDRSNEYMFNQLYLIAERMTKVENDCGIDLGGRVDLLYGEDRRYADGVPAWIRSGTARAVLRPGDAADVRRLGRQQVGVPRRPLPGPLRLRERDGPGKLLLFAQLRLPLRPADHAQRRRGDVQDQRPVDGQRRHRHRLERLDRPDRQDQLLRRLQLDQQGPEDHAGLGDVPRATPTPTIPRPTATTIAWSSRRRSARSGSSPSSTTSATTTAPSRPATGFTHGDWFSFAPYFIYTINDCWSAGMRYEWFGDDDGAVVATVGPPAGTPVPAHYNALTWGVNWKPHQEQERLGPQRTPLRLGHRLAARRPAALRRRPEERSVPLGDRLDREVLNGIGSTPPRATWGAPATRWWRCPPSIDLGGSGDLERPRVLRGERRWTACGSQSPPGRSPGAFSKL